jgi:nitrous oxidase accessory protein NosD
MRGLVVIAAAVSVLCLAPAAQATHISCGQTITTDTVLDSDLSCSTNSALIVNADDVTVDLNGHQVEANGTGEWGVRNTLGSDRTTIKNGAVRGFETAGVGVSGDDGVVEGVTFVDNHAGLNFDSAKRARAEGNRFELNLHGVVIHNDDRSEGDNVVLQNVFDGGGALNSSGLEIFNTTGNRIEDNVLSGIEQGVNMTSVVGTRLEGNQLNIAEGASWGMILFGDDVVSDNVIVDNTIEGGSLGIWHSLTGTGSRIAGNTIVGSGTGILWEVTSPDMRIEDNVVDDAAFDGIQLDWIGGTPRPAHRTIIAGNRVTGSGRDGILVEENPGEVLVEGNLVSGNVDDGIETGPDPFGEEPTRPALVSGNSASENGDWGIVAASPASDGGGNRAWSNGQVAQCLNVVCGPGPPASLSLSPEDATNTVGERHCVTATVSDPDGRATPGVLVRFSVDSGEEGSVGSDASGQSEFCYEGPLTPGTDAISAYADTDGDGAQDPGEPADSASKSWVLPASSDRCRVRGTGSIVASNGDSTSFRINAHVHNERSRGSLFYEDPGPADALVVRSSRMSSLTCTGSSASVFGRTHGSAPPSFRIDVVDAGAGGDSYRIRVSNGYDSGIQLLTSGNIWVH